MDPSTTDTDCRQGFTLVELMVVLAVIAILLSMAMRAADRAGTTGERAQCLNHLRQFGLACQLYWQDNQGRPFPFRQSGLDEGDRYWFGWLSRGGEGLRRVDVKQGSLFPYFGGRGVEICPALDQADKRFKFKALGATYGYGYNLNLSAQSYKGSLNMDLLSTPHQLALFADAAQINTFQPPASPEWPLLEEFYYINPTEPTVHFRHLNGANTVFADGHAGLEEEAPYSLDLRMPGQKVGRLPDRFLATEY